MMKQTFYRLLGALAALTAVFGTFFFSCSAGAETTEQPEAMLEPGYIVNIRMKSVAAGTELSDRVLTDDIKAIRMADSLPEDFVPSALNTVSAADSRYPVYIFFDNDHDAGIMYFYTEGKTISMNPDSSQLFAYNTALTDVSCAAGWDTSHAVDMKSMFSGDSSLLCIDVSGWDTSSVTTMARMFMVGENWKGNGQLTEITGLGSLDVSNVTDMTSMFYGAGEMTYYDIGSWDVSKVESMNHMFADNVKLRSLDLSRWDVSSLKTVYCMFDDNHSLRTIGDVSHWNTANLVDASAWLADAIAFVGDNTGTLDLSGWDTRNMKAAVEMFNGIKSRTIDLSGWSFDAVTNEMWPGTGLGIYYETGNSPGSPGGLSQMFLETYKLTRVYMTQSTLDSYNRAVERGANTLQMWSGSKCPGFTVK